MSETPVKGPRSQFQVSALTGTFVVLVATALLGLFIFLTPMCVHRHEPPPGAACMTNLRQLGLCFIMYAEDHGGQYPPAERWCDLLVEWYSTGTGESAENFRKTYCCPKAGEDAWGYAMNPHAGPESDPDVVLLFESDAAWNGCGGPELLVTGRHGNGGCCVSFVDGSVRFVMPQDVNELKWEDMGTLAGEPSAQRQDADDEEPN